MRDGVETGDLMPEAGPMPSVADALLDWLAAVWKAPGPILGPLVGRPGYTLPDLAGLSVFELRSGSPIEKIDIKARIGGSGNFLVAPAGWQPARRLSITVHEKAKNCILVIGPDANFSGDVNFYAERGAIIIGGGMKRICSLAINLWSDDCAVFWGQKATSNSAKIIVDGEAGRVTIGDDCMFSGGVMIRTSDRHAIISMDTEEMINLPANVVLEPRVWLGTGVTVLKGVRIGFGTVVGTQSIVTRDVGRFSVAAGQPARVLQTGVGWSRRDTPERGLAQRLRASEAQLDPWSTPAGI